MKILLAAVLAVLGLSAPAFAAKGDSICDYLDRQTTPKYQPGRDWCIPPDDGED